MITRAEFIVRSALAGGGLYGAGAVAPLVQRALAQEAPGDLAILDLALKIEATQSLLYERLLKLKGYDAEVKKAFKEIAAHEKAHQDQLKDTLGQLSPPGKRFQVTAVTLASPSTQATLLDQAIRTEEIGLAAYNGAVPELESADLVVALSSIAQVEGRHVGALRELAGKDPAPVAFDRALSPDEAQKRI